MIKVSVMYANQPGARFDHDYYRDKHMPLVRARLGFAYTIDKGLSGGVPGSAPAYIAMCHLLCASVEDFERALAPHADELNGDIHNFTTIAPTYQISEIVAG